MSIQKRIVLPLLFFALFLTMGMVWADQNQSEEDNAAEKKAHVSLKLSTDVKARPEFVWSSIHDARTKYPGLQSAKIISEDDRSSVFEQKFMVPFLGEATSRFSLTDSPPDKVDYKLLDSTAFAIMDGSWILAPQSDGKSTNVEVSCNVATKRIFPKLILKMMLGRKLAKQLDFVKTTAEGKEADEQAAQKTP
jgi:hypothetical protein